MGTKRNTKPRPLTETDELVLRAVRWNWWQQYHSYMHNGNSQYIQNITVSNQEVHRTLEMAFRQVPYDQRPSAIPRFDNISYRLRKLAKRGLLDGRGYGGYRIKDADGYIKTVVEEAKRKEAEKAERIREEIGTIKKKLDYLIPGHGITVEQSRYYNNTVAGGDVLALQLVGLVEHLRFVLLLAEREQRRQDEVWKKAMDDLSEEDADVS